MITKVDYLKAVEIIKQYKIENLKTTKTTNKKLLILNNTDIEIINLLKKIFKNDSIYFHFTQLVNVIKKIYETEFKKTIGRNNAVMIICALIERNIIIKKGERGFSTYFLNFNK